MYRYQRSVLLRWPSYSLHWRVSAQVPEVSVAEVAIIFSPLEGKVHRYQRSMLLRWPSYSLPWRVKCTGIRGQYCIESLCDDQLFSWDTVALLLGLFHVSGLWRGTSRD